MALQSFSTAGCSGNVEADVYLDNNSHNVTSVTVTVTSMIIILKYPAKIVNANESENNIFR